MLENYVDDVYDALNDNKVAIGLVTVYEEDLFEQLNIRTAGQLPIALVDGTIHRRTRENHMYKEMVVTIMLLFNPVDDDGKYTPVSYKNARAAAWAMEEDIGETYLRNVATWEEPESVDSEGGLILIGNRKIYGLLMTVTTLSPVTS